MTLQTTLDSQERFAFGKNWSRFLTHLNEASIEEATQSLKGSLNITTLYGKRFLDIGSGSGLFSLAAHRLGAEVYSFDFDADSVTCTTTLKKDYGSQDPKWSIEQGSVLDRLFLEKFGPVDILYSWGVLHHTGHMYQAFENVSSLVKKGGYLFISIYNDQGGATRRWKWVKEKYNKGSALTRGLLILGTLIRQWTVTFIKDFLRSGNPLSSWNNYKKNNRGMSAWYDILDWVGGYPFEVAKPEEVFEFFKNKGFRLEKLKTCAGGIGCNEFVFIKE